MANFIILDKDLKVFNIIVAETKEDADSVINLSIHSSMEQEEFMFASIGWVFDESKNEFYNPNEIVDETPVSE